MVRDRYAAVLSLIVCCIPPLQRFLDQLQPLRGALASAGNCSIPLTLVVLGGFMHEEDDQAIKKKKEPEQGSGVQTVNGRPKMNKRTSLRKSTVPSRPGETRTVIVAILSRMIVAPALLLPLLWWYSLGQFGVQDDPVFVVSTYLFRCSLAGGADFCNAAACLAIGSPPALVSLQSLQ